MLPEILIVCDDHRYTIQMQLVLSNRLADVAEIEICTLVAEGNLNGDDREV